MSGSQRSVSAGQSSGAMGIFGFALLTLLVLWSYRQVVLYGGKPPANFVHDLGNFFDWVYHLLLVAHPIFGGWVFFSIMVGGVAVGRFFGSGTKVADAHDFSSLANQQKN